MKQNELVFLLISSFVLVVAWIGFNLYNKSTNSRTEDTLGITVQPIDPSFDTVTLEQLKQRTHVDPLFGTGITLPQPTPTATPAAQLRNLRTRLTPVPSPTSAPVATPSAQ